jgi:hypothetical protein
MYLAWIPSLLQFAVFHAVVGKTDYRKAPSKGFCASQNRYYYGYKLHAVCGISGVIHSFVLTKASVHDIRYLNDLKWEMSDCTLLGDNASTLRQSSVTTKLSNQAYISKEVQLDLFETARIRLEVPYHPVIGRSFDSTPCFDHAQQPYIYAQNLKAKY